MNLVFKSSYLFIIYVIKSRKYKLALLFLRCSLVFITLLAKGQSFPNSVSLSTGQGLPFTYDPNWKVNDRWFNTPPTNTLSLTYNPAYINNNCAPAFWVNPQLLPPPVNNGNWITSDDATCGSAIRGYRVFRLSLNLPSDCNGSPLSEHSSYRIFFSGYVDNLIHNIYINGSPKNISGGGLGYGQEKRFALNGPWMSGLNHIDVVIYNSEGPSGLLLVADTNQSSLSDLDGDGIKDLDDLCPCDPGVDPDGCPLPAPGIQSFCDFGKVADLIPGGNLVNWYDTPNGGMLLSKTTALINGQTYYYANIINGIENPDRGEVKVYLNNSILRTSSTEICEGESVDLEVETRVGSLCNMDITLVETPLGSSIPGFTYKGVFNGHHYYLYNTPTTWTQGEAICRANGGYLVCINDADENNFVSSLTDNNIWIGMLRDSVTGNFKWLDCQAINYTNWRSGEPNNAPFGEPYVQIIRACTFGLNTWNNLDDNSANGSCYSNMVPIMEIDPSIYESSQLPTFLWSTGETTQKITTTPTTTTTYWVDSTANGITCRKYTTIIVSPKIIPVFNQVSPVCEGNFLTELPTISTNGIVGTWSPAFTSNITTNYTFTPTLGQCATTTSMTIVVNPLPAIPNGLSEQIFCAISNPTIEDLITNSTNINWYLTSLGGSPLNTTYRLVDGITLYAAAVSPETLCESTARLQVTIRLENPELPEIKPLQIYCKESNMTLGLVATNGVQMQWYDQFNGGNLVSNNYILQNGDIFYGAAVNTNTGCESTNRVPLEIKIINANLIVYNFISIDGDDLNKELIIEGIEQFPENHLEIFNRYGKLVWSGKSYNNTTNVFNGLSNVTGVVSKDSFLPSGTYFYLLSYPNTCSNQQLKGFIQIVSKL